VHFFAVQYQIAFSASVKGAAIFAGGPYYCAQSGLTDAFLMCMDGLESIPLSSLEAYASQQARNGDIDSLGNLTSQNVFLFSGSLDTTVSPVVMHSLEQMYKDFGVTNVKSNFGLTAAHTFPTLTYGNLCTLSYLPYISACNYDGAGNAFKTIYGDLNNAGSPVSANIITYNQADYTSGSPSSISLASTGYAYIPTGCKIPSNNTCKIHVAFHGCLQYAGLVSTQFVANAGYNSWAESNNIIVLYPQATSSLLLPSNPNGCWDWWGYNSADYALKSAPQMAFAHKLISDFIQKY